MIKYISYKSTFSSFYSRFALLLPTIPIQLIFNCCLVLSIKGDDTMNLKRNESTAPPHEEDY